VTAADIELVTVSAGDDQLEIRFTMAGSGRNSFGNRTLDVSFSPVDGSYPNADLSVMQSEGLDDQMYVDVRASQGDVVTVQDHGGTVGVDGRDVVVTVPVSSLGAVAEAAWQWSAEVTASADGALVQDACGTPLAGPGSPIVLYDQPS
jgi:hypothetical protein